MAVSVEGGQTTGSARTSDVPLDLSTLLELTRIALLRRYGEQPPAAGSAMPDPAAEPMRSWTLQPG
jgi:hypothetical protein